MRTKTCARCGLTKDLETGFSKHKGKKDGHESGCKTCESSRVGSWQAAHPAVRAEITRRWMQANPDKERAIVGRSSQKARDAVFGYYGRSCACCGATEDLSIDHVGGGGSEHRTEVVGAQQAAGVRFYRWLIRQGFPAGFQTLCIPCNSSKGSGSRCRLSHLAAV